MRSLSRMSDAELRLLAAELASGRLSPPFGGLSLLRYLDATRSAEVAAELAGYAGQGFTAVQLSALLEAIIADRCQRSSLEDLVHLVATSRTDDDGCRDTSAVVQAMFAAAEATVDVVGYAVYQGRDVFRVLAERMEEVPQLRVRMFLNIARPDGDTSLPQELVRRFVARFQQQHWPEGVRLPELYYDPRAVHPDGAQRASLHAKCVVVDSRLLFVSSANFTEAGHQRNIELGLSLKLPRLARQLVDFLDHLVACSVLVKAG